MESLRTIFEKVVPIHYGARAKMGQRWVKDGSSTGCPRATLPPGQPGKILHGFCLSPLKIHSKKFNDFGETVMEESLSPEKGEGVASSPAGDPVESQIPCIRQYVMNLGLPPTPARPIEHPSSPCRITAPPLHSLPRNANAVCFTALTPPHTAPVSSPHLRRPDRYSVALLRAVPTQWGCRGIVGMEQSLRPEREVSTVERAGRVASSEGAVSAWETVSPQLLADKQRSKPRRQERVKPRSANP